MVTVCRDRQTDVNPTQSLDSAYVLIYIGACFARPNEVEVEGTGDQEANHVKDGKNILSHRH